MARSACRRAERASCTNTRPASVSSTARRLSRLNRRNRWSSSSSDNCLLSAGWVMCSLWAALAKFNSSASTMTACRCRTSRLGNTAPSPFLAREGFCPIQARQRRAYTHARAAYAIFFLLHEILQAEALSRPQTSRMVPVSDLVGRFKRQSPLAARGQCPGQYPRESRQRFVERLRGLHVKDRRRRARAGCSPRMRFRFRVRVTGKPRRQRLLPQFRETCFVVRARRSPRCKIS